MLPLWSAADPALAQSGYPDRPIKVIVPFTAGSGSDTSARFFGDKLALADVLSRSGEVKGLMGRGGEAVKDLSDAKALASGLGDRVALAVTHQRLAQVQQFTYNDLSADRQTVAAVQALETILSRQYQGRPDCVVRANDPHGGLVLYDPGSADFELLYEPPV